MFREEKKSLRLPNGLVVETALQLHGSKQQPLFVMLHPHPLFDGSMYNKVVTTCIQQFAAIGCDTLRFNFRGVGGSTGSFDHGNAESQDVIAILQLLNLSSRSLILGGFSFGAYVALRAAQSLSANAYLLVSPACSRFDFQALSYPAKPLFVLQGLDDDVVDPQTVFRYFFQQQQEECTFYALKHVKHLYNGQIIKLKQVLQAIQADMCLQSIIAKKA